MYGLKDILTFCVGFGIITLCVILIVSGILRWLAPRATRARRLDMLAWIVTAVVSATSLLYFTWGPGGSDSAKTVTFLNAFSKLFTILALGVIAASAVVLLVIIAIYLYNILRVVTHTGNHAHIQDQRLDRFIQTLRTPAVILAAAWGIIALFLILPLLAGQPTSENADLIKIWGNGVEKIGTIFEDDNGNLRDSENKAVSNSTVEDDKDKSTSNTEDTDDNKGKFSISSSALVTYTLIYIIVLGVGLAVIKILHSIITQSIEEKTCKDLIEEYSNPIGLLAVGVAALWTLKEGDLSGKKPFGIVLELLETFIAVVVIAALVILILEIIRLLMDMKEPFIRQEGRYLFIALVGECTIMVMNMVFIFCGALNSSIGVKENARFTAFEEKVREKMVALMDEQLDTKDEPPTCEQTDNNNNGHERVFEAFDEETTIK